MASGLRIATFLVGIGAAIQVGTAQDSAPFFQQQSIYQSTNPARSQFFSKSGQSSGHTEENFQQNQTQQTFQPQAYRRAAAGSAPVKNYYSDLFGQDRPSSPNGLIRQATATRSLNQPAQGNRVIHAEYVQDKNARNQSVILQASSQEPPSEPSSSNPLPPWARSAISGNQAVEQAQPVSSQPVLPEQGSGLIQTKIHTAPAVEAPVLATEQQAPTTKSVVIDHIESGPQTPSVKIEWKPTSEINVGQESGCELVLTNNGDCDAHGVGIKVTFPSTVRLLETKPEPDHAVDHLFWQFEKLAIGESQTIQVRFIPSQQGSMPATAQVQFSGASQGNFIVREPLLSMKIEGPQEVMLGDPASHSVTISNPGNGIAKNVKLEALIPAGLEHPRGERLVMQVGSLNPGEARSIRLALAAIGGGLQEVRVEATADGGLRQGAIASVNVVAPSLAATISGPGLRYVGRQATYTLGVRNDGMIATSNVRLMHKVPEGFEFVSASRGASYDETTRILSWFVGKLNAKSAAEMNVELIAREAGDFVHYIRATSEHGSMTDNELMTRVEGTPSLVLEIVDLDDPVEVGTETAYEVRVTNEGTAKAQNVGISCELPSGVQFLKASGASPHATDQNVVVFKPLDQIAPGKTITYRIHVIGQVDANLRFRARMSSASSPEPLTFEELTRFYGDVR